VVQPGDLITRPITGDSLYLVVAPIGSSRIAVVGDTGHYVTLGKKRIPELEDKGVVRMAVAFAAGETSRIIRGYSPEGAPHAVAIRGSVGPVRYNSITGGFSFPVSPGLNQTATVIIEKGAKAHPSKSPVPNE
jgi:hypothetical protein